MANIGQGRMWHNILFQTRDLSRPLSSFLASHTLPHTRTLAPLSHSSAVIMGQKLPVRRVSTSPTSLRVEVEPSLGSISVEIMGIGGTPTFKEASYWVSTSPGCDETQEEEALQGMTFAV
jgi:hypothetical protein